MRKSVRLLLVASVLYGTGAHWAALQGAAWASMIGTRLSESSWAEAVSSTFSGQKPCRLCRMVEKASTAEQGPSILRSSPGLDFALSGVPRLRAALSASLPPVLPFQSARFLPAPPPVPPPNPVLPA